MRRAFDHCEISDSFHLTIGASSVDEEFILTNECASPSQKTAIMSTNYLSDYLARLI